MEDSITQQAANDTDEQLCHIKGVVESLLFVNERPVTLDQIKKVLETVSGTEIKKTILSLQNEYELNKRGIMIVEIAGGYQMLSNPAYAAYLRNFYKTKHKEKLSKPALESMAIIAYKQPVTRSDIELIRGVNSDGVAAHLLSKELIKVVGRKDVPGRPYLYGTTKQFLEYFGLKSLDDLPMLEEFPTLQPAAESDHDEMLEADDAAPAAEEALPGSAETFEEAKDAIPEEETVENETAEGAREEETREAVQASGQNTEDPIGEIEQREFENEPEESTKEN